MGIVERIECKYHECTVECKYHECKVQDAEPSSVREGNNNLLCTCTNP